MSFPDAALALIALAFTWSIYRAHKDPGSQFNLFDLIMENGRVSKLAVVFMGAFATMSWVIVKLAADGKLTDVFFASYGAVWVAPIISRLFSTPK